MFIVAIHYAQVGGQPEIQALANVLGKTAYEVRSRLTIPVGGPAVVGVFGDLETTRSVALKLKESGFQVLATSEEKVEEAAEFEVRSFVLGETSFVVESRQGEQLQLAYTSIHSLLRGTEVFVDSETQTVTQKKFSVGRAMMTGGLIRNKKTKTSQTTTTHEREGFLRLYADGFPALVCKENALLYESLGDEMKPSRSANFTHLVGKLRAQATQATYDDRLIRRAGQKQLLGPSLEPETHLPVALYFLSKVLKRNAH